MPGTGALDPRHSRETQPNGYVLRGTALWRPTPEFTARLKVNRAYDTAIDAELSQLSSCPDGPGQAFGVPALGIPPIPFIGNDDCRFDRDLKVVYMDPDYFPGITNGGVPYLTDGHHTFTSLLEVAGPDVRVRVRVQDNLSTLPTSRFWERMEADDRVWLRDADGSTVEPTDLPGRLGLDTMNDDESSPRKALLHQVGEALDSFSADELDARMELLRAELLRLEQAKAHREKARTAAASIFGRS